MSTRAACTDETPFVPRQFFYQQGHQVRTYACSYSHPICSIIHKSIFERSEHITWALIISGTRFNVVVLKFSRPYMYVKICLLGYTVLSWTIACKNLFQKR